MNCHEIFGLQAALLVFSFCTKLASAGLCDSASPIYEKAYVGAYEIRFPEYRQRTYNPPQCRWHITAYRKDYVIHLDFNDVILERDDQHNTCIEKITVYDGSKDTNNILACFCGREEPKIVTSSREALIVFSSNKTSLGNGGFKVKYKAVKERTGGGDTSQILRIAFGGFIGAIAFIVICSGAFRKYKQSRPNRGFFLFGRHRVNTSGSSGSSGTTSGTRSGETGGDGQGGSRNATERLSFRKRVTGFFQDVVLKLTPRRLHEIPSETESSDTGPAAQQGTRSTNNRNGNHSNRYSRRSASLSSTTTGCTNHISSIRSNSNNQDDFDLDTVNMSHYHLEDSMLGIGEGNNGHMNFGYQNIPISSFTSDPDAVRPPTYEDCVNNVNPLYLHHHNGQAFYNRAFDLKDEEQGSLTQAFSPPPPYSEVNHDTCSGQVVCNANRHHSPNQPPQYQTNLGRAASIAGSDTETSNNSVATGNLIIGPNSGAGDTLTPVSITQERSSLPQIQAIGSTAHNCVCVSSLQSALPSTTEVEAKPSTDVEQFDPASESTKEIDLSANGNPIDSENKSINLSNSSTHTHLNTSVDSSCTTAVRTPSNASSAPVDLLRRSGFISSAQEGAHVRRNNHRDFVEPNDMAGEPDTEKKKNLPDGDDVMVVEQSSFMAVMPFSDIDQVDLSEISNTNNNVTTCSETDTGNGTGLGQVEADVEEDLTGSASDPTPETALDNLSSSYDGNPDLASPTVAIADTDSNSAATINGNTTEDPQSSC